MIELMTFSGFPISVSISTWSFSQQKPERLTVELTNRRETEGVGAQGVQAWMRKASGFAGHTKSKRAPNGTRSDSGGEDRNRTCLGGFAGRCITSLLPRQNLS